MNVVELKTLILSLAQDIDFEYHGKSGAICPFSHSDISLAYNGEEITVNCVEDALTVPFVEGKPLAEICEEIIV